MAVVSFDSAASRLLDICEDQALRNIRHTS